MPSMTTPNPTGVKTAESLWRRLEVAVAKKEDHWSYLRANKLPSWGKLNPTRLRASKMRELLATI